MTRLVFILFYCTLIITASCQSQDAYQSQAVEVFPPVDMKYAALYRINNLPVSPTFFQQQWTVVIFGNSPCDEMCLKRLALVNDIKHAKKLFVFKGQADHAKLRELASLFPTVAITMGASAASFDNFYRQFDLDEIDASDKHRYLYLVNPSSKLVYSLPQQGLTATSLAQEMILVNSQS